MQRFIKINRLRLLAFVLCPALGLVTLGPNSSARGGQVFAFGENSSGQLGTGDGAYRSLVPVAIDGTNLGDKRIVGIDAGSSHNLLLAEDGSVYSFGNNGRGRTGLGFANNGFTAVATPLVNLNYAGKKIVQVDGGTDVSFLLDSEGAVYSFGDDNSGATGRGLVGESPVDFFPNTQTLIATPVDTTHLQGKRVAQVSSGTNHTLLLTEDGDVLGFGLNSNARAGFYDPGLAIEHANIPTPIHNTDAFRDKRIVQISAGAHSLLLADDGSVFKFGSDGISIDVTPTELDLTLLGDRKVVQVAAGFAYSLLLTDDGTAYSYGLNEEGQTGLGTSSGVTLRPAPINARSLGGSKITQVAANWDHSLLLTEDGSVFAFGQADLTGTGLDSGNVLTPRMVDMGPLAGRRVISISAGRYHSLLLTVPEPSTFVLLGSAVLGVAFKGFRRRTV